MLGKVGRDFLPIFLRLLMCTHIMMVFCTFGIVENIWYYLIWHIHPHMIFKYPQKQPLIYLTAIFFLAYD